MKYFIILFLTIITFSVEGNPFNGYGNKDSLQIWPKVYGGNLSTWGLDIDEAYDKGYLITGNFMASGSGILRMGIIIKKKQ